MDFPRLRDFLIRHSKPYSNIHHADGSLYMERRFILERKDEQHGHVRLHHICTEDRDQHFHDHPFSFWSFVLTGGYCELRPRTRGPCFYSPHPFGKYEQVEEATSQWRYSGDFAYRHACDRHRIVYVLPDTWTLVFAGPLRQWWGFYTKVGKIHWRDYETSHINSTRKEQ